MTRKSHDQNQQRRIEPNSRKGREKIPQVVVLRINENLIILNTIYFNVSSSTKDLIMTTASIMMLAMMTIMTTRFYPLMAKYVVTTLIAV